METDTAGHPAQAEETLLPRDVERIYKRSKQTLAHWRTKGVGPEYFEVNGRIIYTRRACDAFFFARPRRSTSEVA
ncbi:MAG TPA: hypothetical protein PLA85_13085 [Micropepsaceae bacterium]|nr:hypothetical protein [Micropepsaceae bacterium]